jgi:hypothetical protein
MAMAIVGEFDSALLIKLAIALSFNPCHHWGVFESVASFSLIEIAALGFAQSLVIFGIVVEAGGCKVQPSSRPKAIPEQKSHRKIGKKTAGYIVLTHNSR